MGEKAQSFSKGNYTEVKNRAKIYTHCIHFIAKKKQRNLLKKLECFDSIVFTDKQDLYSNTALSADIQASDILNTAFYEQSLTVVQNLQPHHVYRIFWAYR